MKRYMKVEDGEPVGVPHTKPAKIEISPGVIVGCGHWPDSELAKYYEFPCPATFNPECEVETGYTFDAEAGKVTAIIEPASLEQNLSKALAKVDADAEALRAGVITSGDGQMMSYQAKNEEAMDCLENYTAEAPPPDGTYALLSSEVGITGTAGGTPAADQHQVAVVVRDTRQAWLVAEAGINRVRLQAKSDLKAAADAYEVQAILSAIAWPNI